MQICARVIVGRLRLFSISLLLLQAISSGQETSRSTPDKQGTTQATRDSSQQSPQSDKQINVNWFYGSYVPNNVPLKSLDTNERFKLYIRQTYTTWGIYVKTTFFTLRDQAANTEPQWGTGWAGFGKRLGTRQAQFVIQNSVSSLGNGLLSWEPRYDRCHCSKFWPRTRHAVVRNFVTYARDEKSLRPQLMPYVGAFVGGTVVSAWKPGTTHAYIPGYQGAITQIFVGSGINWISEFAPEIGRVLRPKRKNSQTPKN